MFCHIQTLFCSLRISFRELYQAIISIKVLTHFHVEPSYFVCVYITFTFVFYQSYAVVFAESAFFHNSAFLGRSNVSRNPHGGVLQCSVGVFASQVSYEFFLYKYFFLMSFTRQCVLHSDIIVCIYICLQYFSTFFAAVYSGATRGPVNVRATSSGLILLPEMHCVAVNSKIQCNVLQCMSMFFAVISLQYVTIFGFLV